MESLGPLLRCSEAWANIQLVRVFYRQLPFVTELPNFSKAFSLNLPTLAEREISSSGYVVDTLTAALWCLLTSNDYQETVLKAIKAMEHGLMSDRVAYRPLRSSNSLRLPTPSRVQSDPWCAVHTTDWVRVADAFS